MNATQRAAGGAASGSMRDVYRRLLRAAQYYPSVKRASVIQQIKDEFRASRGLPEGKELTARVEEAHTVLQQLERYSPQPGPLKDRMGRNAYKWDYAMKVPGQA